MSRELMSMWECAPWRVGSVIRNDIYRVCFCMCLLLVRSLRWLGGGLG